MKNLVVLFKSALLIVGVVFSLNSFAAGEKVPVAKIGSDMHIVLPTDKALSSVYEADLTCFSFRDADHAAKFFNYFNSNLVTFETDYAKGKVTILLNVHYLKAGQNWDLSDWQKHLDQKYEVDKNNVQSVLTAY